MNRRWTELELEMKYDLVGLELEMKYDLVGSKVCWNTNLG